MANNSHENTLQSTDPEAFPAMLEAWRKEEHTRCKGCIEALVEKSAAKIANRVMKGRLTRAVIEDALLKSAFQGAIKMWEDITVAYHAWYHANREGDCHDGHPACPEPEESDKEIEALHDNAEAQALEAYRLAYNKFVDVDVAEARAAGGAVDMDLIEDNARQAAADIYREKYDTCMGYLDPTDPDPDFSIAASRRVFRKFTPEPAPLPHAPHLRLV